MIYAFLVLIVILLILIVIFVPLRSPQSKNVATSESDNLRVSGIYSIVRKSPREDIKNKKPTDKEILKYLATLNENITGKINSDKEKLALIDLWNNNIEKSIQTIEKGDLDGAEFYFYDFKQECEICKPVIANGHFVTRQELYKYPHLIPPFHLGCTCQLRPHHSKDSLDELSEKNMTPFLKDSQIPQMPDWKQIS